MSLKAKLILVFGALMVSLMITHAAIVQHLAGQTVEEYGTSLLEVSRQLASAMTRGMFLANQSGDGLASGTVQETKRIVKHYRPGEDDGKPESPVVETAEESFQLSPGKRRIFTSSTRGADPEDLEAAGFKIHMEMTEEHQLGMEEGESVKDGSGFVLRLQGPGIEDRIEVSTASLKESLSGLSSRLFYGTLAVLVVGLCAVAFVSDRVARPLQELSAAAGRVASGDRGVRVEPRGSQEVLAAMTSFNAMSDRISHYEQRQQQWQQERHLSELGEIARSLAHTIRNPLNTIGLSIEELAQKAGQDDPDVTGLVHSSRNQIRQIDDWIRSFLSLASQEGSYLEPVDVALIIEDIVLEVTQTGSCRVRIGDGLDTSLPSILGVGSEIRAMIQALVANAVEASGSGGEVIIDARQVGDGTIETIVSDNGPGLPDRVREQLYAPHVTTKVTGSGMGIYLTQRIASNRYGGTLDFTDNQPSGTIARLQLSLRRGA